MMTGLGRWRSGRAVCLAVMLGALAPAARADGSYLQIDGGDDTVTAVVSQVRGRLSYGAAHTDYGSGRQTSLNLGLRQPFLFWGGEMTASVGPVAVHDGDEWSFGARATLDHYRTTYWGSLYLLGEIDSAVNGYFALAQAGLGDRGLGLELSAGGSDAYDEVSAAVTYRLPDTPVTLRAGRRFDAEAVFFGASINTF